MKFISTRNTENEYSAYDVILRGIAPDGGLFFPKKNVVFDENMIDRLKDKPYYVRAAEVIYYWLAEDFTKEELTLCCKQAYSEDAFPLTPSPLEKHGDSYYLELYHGPTCAFKDLALQLMPRLMKLSIEKSNIKKDALILVATSGDTGKAALEGFKDVDRVKIMVFFPENGVSEIQKQQMQSQKGENVWVYGVNGNFDDCQTAVKRVLTSDEIKEKLAEKGMFFSSANSINFARLVPQTAYYVSAVADMGLEKGESVNITVPTGNFGNILAAYMAKKAGLPIGKLICASNKNNILTDFFNKGVYDKRREFYVTSSPSMDILVSSNLERLLYLVCGSEKTREYMNSLKENGVFEVDSSTLDILKSDFDAFYTDENETLYTINNVWKTHNYLIDTHTAVAVNAYEKYKKTTGDTRKNIIVSTASPFKFAPAVCKALEISAPAGFAACDALEELTKIKTPRSIVNIRNEEKRYTTVLNVSSIGEAAEQTF